MLQRGPEEHHEYAARIPKARGREHQEPEESATATGAADGPGEELKVVGA